jgi:hypothetical protein
MSGAKIAVVCLAVALAGCGARKTITPTHGLAYRAAFGGQRAAPARGPVDPAPGLDSQEAAIIAASYRNSLAPKGERPEQEPQLLIVAPQKPGSAARPAPSVPGN